MLNHREKRLRDIDVVADAVRAQLLGRDVGIDTRRAFHVERSGIEHVFWILAHGEHAPLRIVVRHEMNVRELGDRVAHALVDAAGQIAAFDVRDRLVQIRGGHGDRELFEPIAADDDDVRIGRVEAVGDFERREARGLRHRDVVAAFDDVEERRRNREAAVPDVVGDVAAVLIEQNRPA